MTPNSLRLRRLAISGDMGALDAVIVELRRADDQDALWQLLTDLPIGEAAGRRSVLRALVSCQSIPGAWWLYRDAHLRSLTLFDLGPNEPGWRNVPPHLIWMDATSALQVLAPLSWEQWLMRGRIRLEKHAAALLLALAMEQPQHRESLVESALAIAENAGLRLVRPLLFDAVRRALEYTGLLTRAHTSGGIVLGERVPLVPDVKCADCFDRDRCCLKGLDRQPHWSTVLPPRR